MIEYKKTQGSENLPIEFGETTVYVRTNINEIENGNWEYDEVQYTYDEWTKLQSEEIELLKTENEELKESQIRQDCEIVESMLATIELFEMMLSISAQIVDNKNVKNVGGKNMVQVYVTLILKGIKTIEDVPLMIREDVQKQLDILMK